jgi:hypothetical protein
MARLKRREHMFLGQRPLVTLLLFGPLFFPQLLFSCPPPC